VKYIFFGQVFICTVTGQMAAVKRKFLSTEETHPWKRHDHQQSSVVHTQLSSLQQQSVLLEQILFKLDAMNSRLQRVEGRLQMVEAHLRGRDVDQESYLS
jgi:hypothetical protein